LLDQENLGTAETTERWVQDSDLHAFAKIRAPLHTGALPAKLEPVARRPFLPSFVGNLLRRREGRPRHGVEVDVESVFFGTSYGGYEILPGILNADAVVYSAGLGEDVSFDLEIIRRFACVVHGFDPTPRSLAWLETQGLPERFVVHPYGLAEFDGVAGFAPPKNPAHVSHSVLPGSSAERVELPVKRLTTVLRELGHERLDVLKLDIEGAEYAVLDDLLATGPLPRQLMVEFHHGMGDVTLESTERCLDRLRAAGYRVFDARETGREFSLARI
jgi:FkbM family methyltransferase